MISQGLMLRRISLSLLCFALIGCGDAERDSFDSPSTALENPRAAFTPKVESLEGDWYIIATNPNPRYRGKIVTDYIRYSFREGGEVIKTTNSGGDVSIDRGTFKLYPDRGTFETTLDLGDAGVQVTSWRQTSPGRAETFYWKNLTHGHEHPEHDQFVMENSAEWHEREKVSVNTERVTIPTVDPQQLEVGAAYQLSEETSLMPELDPVDPISAIERIAVLPAGAVVRIVSEADKRGTPWYNVRVVGTGDTGWINSIGLVGHSLERRP